MVWYGMVNLEGANLISGSFGEYIGYRKLSLLRAQSRSMEHYACVSCVAVLCDDDDAPGLLVAGVDSARGIHSPYSKK